MADQDETITDGEPGVAADDDAEVEGFGSISTTRSNIKNNSMSAAPAISGIGIGGQSGYAIKEQGVK